MRATTYSNKDESIIYISSNKKKDAERCELVVKKLEEYGYWLCHVDKDETYMMACDSLTIKEMQDDYIHAKAETK